jgi:hypothetical protein
MQKTAGKGVEVLNVKSSGAKLASASSTGIGRRVWVRRGMELVLV